jgi:hypothetical protein
LEVYTGDAIPLTLLKMEKTDQIHGHLLSGTLSYGWPAPLGLSLILAGYGVAHFFGQRAFHNTHFWFEIGIITSMLASVVYTIRLSGKGRKLAPRWVFVLNLCFGPLIFGFFMISGLIPIL